MFTLTIAMEADLIGLGLTCEAPSGEKFLSTSSWLLFLENRLLLISFVDVILQPSSEPSVLCCGDGGCCWMDLTGKVHRLIIGDEGRFNLEFEEAGAEVESCLVLATGEESGLERAFDSELMGDEISLGLESGEASGDKGLMLFAEENRRIGLGLVFGDRTISGGIRWNGTSTTIRSSFLPSARCCVP